MVHKNDVCILQSAVNDTGPHCKSDPHLQITPKEPQLEWRLCTMFKRRNAACK